MREPVADDLIHVLEARIVALEAAVAAMGHRLDQTATALLGLVERNGRHIDQAQRLIERMNACIERIDGADERTLQ